MEHKLACPSEQRSLHDNLWFSQADFSRRLIAPDGHLGPVARGTGWEHPRKLYTASLLKEVEEDYEHFACASVYIFTRVSGVRFSFVVCL
jgi:hypothetical protein